MAEWLKAHAWKACVRETVPWVRIPLSPPERPATPALRAPSTAQKPRFCGLSSFQVRPAESGEGPIFLRKGGFSPNLWTARIQYGFENALISVACKGDREAHFAVRIG